MKTSWPAFARKLTLQRVSGSDNLSRSRGQAGMPVLLTPKQDQYSGGDGEYGQDHRDGGRNSHVKQGQEPGENQPDRE